MTFPRLGYKDGYLQKLGYFHLDLFPKLWTYKTSPRQVDSVVNKSRRRSSLWITPTTVERVVAECISLSYVGQL